MLIIAGENIPVGVAGQSATEVVAREWIGWKKGNHALYTVQVMSFFVHAVHKYLHAEMQRQVRIAHT